MLEVMQRRLITNRKNIAITIEQRKVERVNTLVSLNQFCEFISACDTQVLSPTHHYGVTISGLAFIMKTPSGLRSAEP